MKRKKATVVSKRSQQPGWGNSIPEYSWGKTEVVAANKFFVAYKGPRCEIKEEPSRAESKAKAIICTRACERATVAGVQKFVNLRLRCCTRKGENKASCCCRLRGVCLVALRLWISIPDARHKHIFQSFERKSCFARLASLYPCRTLT